MRSDGPGGVGGGDGGVGGVSGVGGVGGCECQWFESEVVGGCDGSLVVRSCLPCPASTHSFSTRQSDDLDLKQVVSGGAELRGVVSISASRESMTPCHIRHWTLVDRQ